MGRLGTFPFLGALSLFLFCFGGVEGNVQYLWYPVPVTPTTATTYLRRSPGKSVHFQVRNHDDGSYHFGYDADTIQGDKSFREERRDGVTGAVTGSYGWVDPEGTLRVVEYIPDHLGYRTLSSNKKPLGIQLYTEPIQVIGPIPKPFADLYHF